MDNRCSTTEYMFSYKSCHVDLWCLGSLDREKQSKSWPKDLGARGYGEVYIVSAGGPRFPANAGEAKALGTSAEVEETRGGVG